MTKNYLHTFPNIPSNPSRLSRQAAAAINRSPQTDLGNAELFVLLFRDRVRYDHMRDRWLIWQGQWWAADTDAEVVRLAKQIPRIRAKAAPFIEDDSIRTA